MRSAEHAEMMMFFEKHDPDLAAFVERLHQMTLVISSLGDQVAAMNLSMSSLIADLIIQSGIKSAREGSVSCTLCSIKKFESMDGASTKEGD